MEKKTGGAGPLMNSKSIPAAGESHSQSLHTERDGRYDHISLRESSSPAEDLCCCEYINDKGERSHLLGLCCDCDTLDDSFERMIQGQSVPISHFHEMCSVMSDRLRIPWVNGARRIDFLGLSPFALLPAFGLLATIGPFATGIVFLLIPIIVRLVGKFNANQKTTFHYSFSLSSLLCIFLVNYSNDASCNSWIRISHTVLLISILIGVNLVKRNSQRDDSLVTEALPFYYYCRKCKFYLDGRDHHCNWLNCCIGLKNRKPFISTLVLGVIWGLFIIYMYHDSCYTIPSPMKGLYSDNSTALAFVTVVYSGIISIFLLAILAHQLNMVRKGVSYLDWKFKKTLK